MTSPTTIVRISTPRLLLRSPAKAASEGDSTTPDLNSSDAEGFVSLFTNPATFEHEPHKPDPNRPREELFTRYKSMCGGHADATGKGTAAQLVVRLAPSEGSGATEGQMIGCGGVNEFRAEGENGVVADIGVMIHSTHWRKGYGSETLRALMDWVFAVEPASGFKATPPVAELLAQNEALKGRAVTTVFAQTLHSNKPFQALMASLGFPGKEDPGTDFGPEFQFNITRDEWLAKSKRQ